MSLLTSEGLDGTLLAAIGWMSMCKNCNLSCDIIVVTVHGRLGSFPLLGLRIPMNILWKLGLTLFHHNELSIWIADASLTLAGAVVLHGLDC